MANINIYLRVRPLLPKNQQVSVAPSINFLSPTCVALKSFPKEVFNFDYIADQTTPQNQVFEIVGKTMVDKVLSGYNGTIFAYGQTGSGKTFTMQGKYSTDNRLDFDLRGLIPRCFEYLFYKIETLKKTTAYPVHVSCQASYIEIYNETVYDLMDSSKTPYQLREDQSKNVFAEGVTKKPINNSADALQMLMHGISNRSVRETEMNSQSSRSHSVFVLYVEIKHNEKDGCIKTLHSKFNLVDLAGSERQKTTRVSGLQLKEAANINKGLSALGKVINSLADNRNELKRSFINYRDSKLTYLLKDSLGGNSITTFIATVSPLTVCDNESLSTMRYMQRTKLIKNKVSLNHTETSNDTNILKQEIIMLKDKLKKLEDVSFTKLDSNTSYNTCVSEVFKPRANIADWLAFLSIRKLEEETRQKNLATKVLLQMHFKVKKQCKSIQQLKLILKLKDSENNKLRKNSSAMRICEAENGALREEVRYLAYQQAAQPDLDKLMIENIQLKEQLQSYEKREKIRDLDLQKKKNTIIPSIESLTNQIGELINLNYTGVFNSVELPVDTVEIEHLNSKINSMQDYISELEQQREKLEYEILNTDQDWQVVNNALCMIEPGMTESKKIEIIDAGALREEVRYLAYQQAAQPDLDKLMIENIQLKEQLQSYEKREKIRDLDLQKKKNTIIPSIESLTNQIGELINLNYTGVFNSVELPVDTVEIEHLNSKINSMQDYISELEQQREKLEYEILNTDQDWQVVNNALCMIEPGMTESKKIEIIDAAMQDVVWDSPKSVCD
ncbi:hypothetical protein BB561_006106 [Smittium simulii]|uniref:Kinesin-like protein n=1 Tax=Smittium simulii TaxID=133385 RepID=A0A2T9Y6I9_9FUNG|nr:hypothetical protein BB561_006106 [Smittium simulii]